MRGGGGRGRFGGAALALALALALPGRALALQVVAVKDVRVFDGERTIPRATVVVRDGRIAAVGPDVPVPAGAEVVPGAGRTLLPALIDAHSHTWAPPLLEQALVFGVATQLDMMTAPAQAAAWRAEQAAGEAAGRADLLSAGVAATAPGGHGTQFGLPVPTLTDPAEAPAWVAVRVREGSDFIKIIHDDGSAYGVRFPTLSEPAMRALVEAAHAQGRKAVVHVATLRAAREAVRAGADGLAHVWLDSLPDAALVGEMAHRGVFVVPTLAVSQSATGTPGSVPLLGDARLLPFLGPEERAALGRSFPAPTGPAAFRIALGAVGALARGGVPVLAGTDAPNPGTLHGATMHRELELLVEAGLSPAEALRAATSAPARAFGLSDRGRVAPGLRADLLLVEGDPTADVGATRAVVAVWKAGRAVDRDAFRARTAGRLARASERPAAPARGPGPVSDFEDGTLATRFALPWAETTDRMIGGSSVAALGVVEGGAQGTSRALRIAGTLAAGAPASWSGAIAFPGARPMEAADLSAARGLRLHARGDGRSYAVLLFTRRGGRVPLTRAFTAGPEWAEHLFEWSEFGGEDGSGILAVAVVATGAPGGFALEIDQVELVGR